VHEQSERSERRSIPTFGEEIVELLELCSRRRKGPRYKQASYLSEAKDEGFHRLVKRLLSYSSSARDAEKVPTGPFQVHREGLEPPTR
jgi:hypothetical protein